MPDITMCNFTDCPVKDSCFRHTATPTPHWQAYFADIPGKYVDGKWVCDMYWDERQDAIYRQLENICAGNL